MFLQKDKHHLRLYCGKIKYDNIGYMRAKDGFVKAALADARRWYEVSEEKGP